MTVWPLRHERPVIEVQRLAGGPSVPRWLVANTGAGARRDTFELILDEDDCLHYGGIFVHQVQLGGAYAGSFPIYALDVAIPSLNFDNSVNVVGVLQVPHNFDGIACFRFLR